jgi:peptidoglycan pentaglycine glycine transferase (the first glycine)
MLESAGHMEFFRSTPQDKDRFNAFVAGYPTGDLMQSYEWAQLKSRSGWAHIPVHAERGGIVVAVASLLKRKIPRTGRCILYAPRGPVLDCTDKELVSGFAGFLRQIAVEERAVLVKIDPPIPVEDTVSEADLQASGFKRVGEGGFGGTQPKCVMQLDLDKTEDELLESFKQNGDTTSGWRNARE